MNEERIKKLIATIERLEHCTIPDLERGERGFNMCLVYVDYDHARGCGTPACIAGWTLELFNKGKIASMSDAGEMLGLDGDWATGKLFVPSGIFFSDVTPQMAAEALRKVLALGPDYINAEVQDIWPAEALWEELP